MTTEEWRAKVAADRPPLTRAQLAALRPIFAPVLHHIKAAASARTETAATSHTPATGGHQ